MWYIKKNGITNLLAFVFLFYLFVFSGFAQELSSVKLKIVNQNGESIENPIVIIKDDKGVVVKSSQKSESNIVNILNLTDGNYFLEIVSQGFKSVHKLIKLKKGVNYLEIVLEIEPIIESVSIDLSPREKRFAEATNKIFSEEEIKNLPNEPEEIKKELQRRYGSDVVMKVNGFTGGQFPDKSQIASISVILSPIDAEFHFVGKTVVNITTKVVKTKKWSGFLNFNFTDSVFNARNAFAKDKLPYQNQDAYIWLNPPSFGKNTSVSFSFSGSNKKETRNFLGVIPNQFEDNNRTTKAFSFAPSFTLNQNINQNNSLYLNYSFSQSKGENQGLGNLDSSERSFTENNFSHNIRVSESATFGKYSNQLRFEYKKVKSNTEPNSSESTIIVLGAFNKGGAGNKTKSASQKSNLTDILNFNAHNHLLKIGGEIELESTEFQIADNTNGRFIFSSLDNFGLNKPLLFEQKNQIASFKFSQINTALFFQDYFNPTKNFQLGIGGRWEAQSKAKDYNNFAPRISFVWSPEKTGRLILRSGFGSLFTNLDTSFYSPVLSNDGKQAEELRIINPSFPNPLVSGVILSQIEKPSISQLEKVRNPEIYLSFFGAVYTPIDSIKLTSAFVSSRGNHLPRVRDINSYINGVRPNSNWGIIKFYEFEGNALASLLLIKSESKIKGFAINTTYNLTYSFVDFNEGGLPTDNNNLRLDKGVTNDERRHEINVDTNFTLYRFIKYKPLYNIDIYLAFSAKSGLPYTITTGKDSNNDGIINERPLSIKRNSEREEWNNQTDVRLNWKPSFSKKDTQKFWSNFNKANFTITVQNLFNQTNKQNFVGVETSPFFRQATSSAPARSLHFGVSWLF